MLAEDKSSDHFHVSSTINTNMTINQTWERGLLFYCNKSTLSQPAKHYLVLRNTSIRHLPSIVCRPTAFIWLYFVWWLYW